MTQPLVAVATFAVLVHAGLVLCGRFRVGLDHPSGWSLLAWPLPVLALAATPAIAGTQRLLELVGWSPGLVVVASPWLVLAALTAWRPPRWLFPAWVRGRLTTLPPEAQAPSPDAVPALRCVDPPAFDGVASRWTWRLDAQPGWLREDGPWLRFDPIVPDTPPSPLVPVTYAIEDAEVPADAALERFPLEGGRELRTYPLPAERAAATRWIALAGLIETRLEGRRTRREPARVLLSPSGGWPARLLVREPAPLLTTSDTRAPH